MRLTVEMGNQAKGNQAVRTEDGRIVEGVREVRWSARASERPIIVLELYAEKVTIDLGDPEAKSEAPNDELT
jgi:hypothetical protein